MLDTFIPNPIPIGCILPCFEWRRVIRTSLVTCVC